MKNITKKNKGFTLVELMLTVTIISILTALAVPAYQDYNIKAQVAEGLSLASGGKVVVSEFHANNGKFPVDNNDAGYNATKGKYVNSVNISEEDNLGLITSSFSGSNVNKKINGLTISLIAIPNETGVLVWNCLSDIEQKYLPNSCQYISGGLTAEEIEAIIEKFPDSFKVNYSPVYGNNVMYTYDQDKYFLSAQYDSSNANLTYTLTDRQSGEVQTFVLEPSGMDENGRIVYKPKDGLDFGGEIISTVKIRKDEQGNTWVDAYKTDPNDSSKEIYIRGERA